MTASWAVFLQHFRSPFFDALVYYITELGSGWALMAATPLLYWVWNKKAASRVAVCCLVSAYVNGLLKVFFAVSRPPAVEGAEVLHPETGGGYAFPSGHTQGSTVFWGRWFVETRKVWVFVLGLVVTALVGLSRVYLNVHWPSDVLGGFAAGLALLLVYAAVEALWRYLNPPFAAKLLVCIAVPALVYCTYDSDDAPALAGFLLGFPLGALLEERYVGWNESAPIRVNVLKALVGFGGLLAILAGLGSVMPDTTLADAVVYSLAGFYASFICPLIFAGLGWQR